MHGSFLKLIRIETLTFGSFFIFIVNAFGIEIAHKMNQASEIIRWTASSKEQWAARIFLIVNRGGGHNDSCVSLFLCVWWWFIFFWVLFLCSSFSFRRWLLRCASVCARMGKQASLNLIAILLITKIKSSTFAMNVIVPFNCMKQKFRAFFCRGWICLFVISRQRT